MLPADRIKIPDHYKGREQAYFKHKLLEAYLERLFMIVGQHHNNICYVDCFAGPWQEKSEKLEDTSIAISLKIIEKCREGLKKLGRDVHFKALFIEEEPRAFEKLKAFVKGNLHEGIDIHPLHGEFITLRQAILELCGIGNFAFFFIDPTGWKEAVEPQTLKPFLLRHNSEFLINFMYDFILRAHTQKSFESDIIEIFGEVPDTDVMPPEEKEEHLISLYKENLKRIVPPVGGIPRTVSVKVLKPLRNRTLYHLVYLTRHPLGIVKFMEASEGLDLVQRRVRAFAKQRTRIEKSGQGELFSAEEHLPQKNTSIDLSSVMEYWLKQLTKQPARFDITRLADMLEETGWFIGDFQQAFKELEKDAKVKNLDTKRTRPVNAVNFEKGERLIKTTP